jgi:hypothetical protein
MSVRHSNHSRVRKPLAATVAERQRSLNPMMVTRAARHSQREPDVSCPRRPTFRGDFLLEHSRFGQQAGSIGFVGCF